MSAYRVVHDRRSIIDQVLPEYEKITDAPLRIEDVPGYSEEFSDEEYSDFAARAIAEERAKLYKAVDADGNIYLVANPWTRHIELREDGRHWVVHRKPIKVMSHAEARRKAAETRIATNPPSGKKTPSDYDF